MSTPPAETDGGKKLVSCLNCRKDFSELECDTDLGKTGHMTCKRCFFLGRSRGLYKRISQATACDRFMLQARDLADAADEERLAVMLRDNPRGFGNKMKLFYEFQVALVAEKKFGSLDALVGRMEVRTDARCRAAAAVGDSEGAGEIVAELSDGSSENENEKSAAVDAFNCSSSSNTHHPRNDTAAQEAVPTALRASVRRKRKKTSSGGVGGERPLLRQIEGGAAAKARKVAGESAASTRMKLERMGIPRVGCGGAEAKRPAREIEAFRCRQHAYGPTTDTPDGLRRQECTVCGDVLEWEEF